MESLACVCVCIHLRGSPQRIYRIYRCVISPNEFSFRMGGADWRQLSAIVLCVCGPGELGKTLGVPFEGRQLCWAYLSVWLAFFCSFVIRESLEEGIVKNTHNHHPTLLLALLCFSLSLSTRCVDSGGIYDVRIESSCHHLSLGYITSVRIG